MARSISNMNQLAFAWLNITWGMVNQMTDRVYKTLNFLEATGLLYRLVLLGSYPESDFF